MTNICGIISGLDCPTCEDLKAKAGLVKNIYVGRLSDLDEETPFTYDIDGRIEAINLQYQNYLYKFCAKSKSANYEQPQSTADNGLKLRLPVINGMFKQQGQIAKNVWDSMSQVNDLFVVVETNYGTFEIFFTETGGTMSSDKTSGTNFGDENGFNATFTQPEAGELNCGPDFLDTDYQTTKELLESYLA